MSLVERVRLNGRATVPLTPVAVRPLEPADLLRLQEERGSLPVPLTKRLSERHRALARAIAAGRTNWEAAAITGYSISRISILKGDPTFNSLVEEYKKQEAAQFDLITEKLVGLGEDLIDEIRDRLDTDPEALSINQLNELAKTVLDRAGHGPSSTQQIDVRVGLAAKLEAARKRVAFSRDATDVEVRAGFVETIAETGEG
jgi:hypothetical protein